MLSLPCPLCKKSMLFIFAEPSEDATLQLIFECSCSFNCRLPERVFNTIVNLGTPDEASAGKGLAGEDAAAASKYRVRRWSKAPSQFTSAPGQELT
jgi:hypothetical protein